MVDTTVVIQNWRNGCQGVNQNMLIDRSAILLNSILVASFWRIIKYISRQNGDYLLSLAIYRLYYI